MANKSDSPADRPETTTLNPEQTEAQPGPQAAAEPEAGSFPRSIEDTARQIAANREEIRRLEANVAHSQAEVNRLRNEVDVLNALRQVHGQGVL